MQHYKNYPIDASAVPRHGGGWDAQGVVFDPDPKRTKEIKRLTSGDIIFIGDKEEAEWLALVLCQAWIDGLEKAKKAT